MSWICPACNNENEDSQMKCVCGLKLHSQYYQDKLKQNKKVDAMPDKTPTRYPALRLIAAIYRIMSWLSGIVSFILSLRVAIDSFNNGYNWFIAILPTLSIGFFAVLTLLAVSEGIKVFIDIEENTRNIATIMKGDK